MIVDLLRPLWRLLPIDIAMRQRIQRRLFRTLPFLFRAHPAYQGYRQARARGALWRDGAQQGAPSAPVELFTGAPPEYPAVRLIAFYLPQYHPIPENDAWWGRGFTEWTNVVRAQPRFPGHYQPHLPGELGFYDLRVPEVMARQVELAQRYGVGGFAFYFYWFGGKRLLERPVEDYLASDLALPFCLCWANENWTRRWDGRASEVLMAQEHSSEDDLAFIAEVAPYLRDPRYIRVGGRPLLLVYRPALLPDAHATAERWRRWCREQGIGEIYLAYTQSFESAPPSDYGFDAAIEFPPNNSNPVDITDHVEGLDPEFTGTVFDWTVYPERSRDYPPCDYQLFRGVNPGWDNEARRRGRGTVFLGSTPAGYREWLENAIADTRARFVDPSERLVFINAWNEWAEGAHLEPDARHGYAYLQATRDALVRGRMPARGEILLVGHDAEAHGAQLLALRMAQGLSEGLGLRVVMVLLGDGPLLPEYGAVAEALRLDAEDAARAPGQALAQRLRARGIKRAIVNSTASGNFVPSLVGAGITVTALVHELPELIRRHALKPQVARIAAAARRVVFPATLVREGFVGFAPLAEGQAVIRPQGLYKHNQLAGLPEARARLRRELGLPESARVVLGVGYGNQRKGVDLFARIALELESRREDTWLVWVGDLDAAMARELEPLRARAQRLVFVGRRSDTDLFYAGADCYAMTSREDPFPSVVLEALQAGAPVVAFAGAGGFVELAPSGVVRLAPAFAVEPFAAALDDWLGDEPARRDAGVRGRALVAREFGFRRYLFDLLEIAGASLPRVSVVVPNYNYLRYLPERLDSILAQTQPIYELIVLDDASTDGSGDWLERELPRRAPEAELVRNAENAGSVFLQWLAGVERARGDYVWIAEADDLAHPEFLEEALRGLADPAVVMSYTQSRQIGAAGEVLCEGYLDYVADLSPERWRRPYVAAGREEVAAGLAVKNTIPNVSAVVFRREPLLAVLRAQLEQLRALRVAGDWLTYLTLLETGSIAFSPRALNDHRRHQGGVTLSGLDLGQLREIVAMQRRARARHRLDETVATRADAYAQSLYRDFGLASRAAPHFSDHPELAVPDED